MPAIESITEYLLDSALYDVGESRTRDGRFSTFATAIDEDGKIETYRVPPGETPVNILHAEVTARTTAVSIVSDTGCDAIDVHIDYRDSEPIRIRARYRLRKRPFRKPDLELTDERETAPAERIVFGGVP